jgi:hypothetical protein
MSASVSVTLASVLPVVTVVDVVEWDTSFLVGLEVVDNDDDTDDGTGGSSNKDTGG